MTEPEWKAAVREAYRHPIGPQRVAGLQRAALLAEAAGAHVDAADIRLDAVWEADEAGDTAVTMATYAAVRAQADADPERYAALAHRLDWQAKWMPGAAMAHPQVPLAQVEALIDDLERRHVRAGAGSRSALDVRLTLLRHTGDPAGILAGVLADWRASRRAELVDCPACEALEEVRAVVFLGGTDSASAALGLLEPAVRGEMTYCSAGSHTLLREVVPLLLTAGRFEDADRVHREAVRNAQRQGLAAMQSMAELARLSAGRGRMAEAARLLGASLGQLGANRAPLRELDTCTAAVTALRLLAEAGVATVVVDNVLPDWLALPPGLLPVAELLSAVDRRAAHLAGLFDQRNGTGQQSAVLQEARDFRPQWPVEPLAGDPPPAVHAVPSAGHFQPATSRPLPPAAWREDAGEAPSDPAAWEAWARRLQDRFEWDRASAAAQAIVDDPGAPPALRAMAALVLGTGAEPASFDDPSLPEALRLRLRLWVADVRLRERGEDGPAQWPLVQDALVRARQLVETDPSPETKGALRSALQASVTHALVDPAARGLLDVLAGAGAEKAFEDEPALDLMRWFRVLEGWRVAVDQPGSGGDPLPGALHALDQASAVVEAHGSAWPGFAALLAGAAGDLALAVGRPADAATLAARVEVLVGGPAAPASTAGIRVQAAFLCADARAAAGDGAGAFEAQRLALAVAPALGPEATARARRGYGVLLAQSGRLDEAVVTFAEAAELAAEAGHALLAARLHLDRARAEHGLGDYRRARRSATKALALAGGADDLRVEALEAVATAAEAGGDGDTVAPWIEAADAAPAAGMCPAGYRSAAGRAAARNGDLAQADALFTQALHEVPVTEGPERSWYLGTVLHRRARAAAEIRPQRAIEDAARAAEAFESSGAFEPAAWARYLEADLRGQAGDPAARAVLAEALRLALSAGAHDLVASIRAELEAEPD